MPMKTKEPIDLEEVDWAVEKIHPVLNGS